jgi:hypothetical protein
MKVNVNEGSNGSKGVKFNVTLTLTNKLGYLLPVWHTQ